jgi:hypothetical protein
MGTPSIGEVFGALWIAVSKVSEVVWDAATKENVKKFWRFAFPSDAPLLKAQVVLGAFCGAIFDAILPDRGAVAGGIVGGLLVWSINRVTYTPQQAAAAP